MTLHVQFGEPMTFDRHARQGNHTSAETYQKIAQGKRDHKEWKQVFYSAHLCRFAAERV